MSIKFRCPPETELSPFCRVMFSSEAKLIYAKYDEMIRLLQGYREKIYADWIGRVDRDCQFNLEQPLIHRDPETNLISVNFSKEVCE